MAMLRRGLIGEPVRILQEKLGVEADGVFGGATDRALRQYQQDNGLSVDGIAGPDTFTKMELYELVLVQRGIRGHMVRRVQEALNLDADGIFGGGTENAVKQWQEQNGQDVTGVVEPKMLAALGLPEFTEDKVQASQVTEDTPYYDPSTVVSGDIEPPAQEPGFVEHTVQVLQSAEEKAMAVGKSIWTTVKSLF